MERTIMVTVWYNDWIHTLQRVNKKLLPFFLLALSPWWIQAVFMLQRIQNEAGKGTVGKREIETIDNDQKGYGLQYP